MSVVFKNDKVAYVGQSHGKPPVMSAKDKALVEKITEEHGAWFEGDGKDAVEGVKYKGSWDDELAKTLKDYPMEFLYVLFTNVDVNNQKSILVGDGSIFDRIIATQNKLNYFKNRRYDEATLKSFLSKVGGGLLKASQDTASKANVAKFEDRGEHLMWESGDSPARNLADKANAIRDNWLRARSAGVYYVGKDHLSKLKLNSERPIRGGHKLI
jgi:hypothetical protein